MILALVSFIPIVDKFGSQQFPISNLSYIVPCISIYLGSIDTREKTT